MSQSQSQLDRPNVALYIKEWIESGETNASICKLLLANYSISTSPDSIRRFRRRHQINPRGVEKAYTKVEGQEAEGALEPTTTKPILDDPDSMLEQRGLSPEEWEIGHLTCNEYQGPASAEHTENTGETSITYFQTKFTAQRKRITIPDIILPRTDGWIAPKPVKLDPKMPRLVVIVGDQQAPFQDPHLHSCFLEWLKVNQPQQGVSLGDSIDLPDISRHDDDPENTATVNECLQSGYDLFRGYVDASPDTHWKKIPGNHDERLRSFFLRKASNLPMYGLKRPVTPEGDGGESVHSPRYLLRLDELGIEYVDPHGKYDLAQIDLSGKLAVRHGWIARQGSGASALETLRHTGYSIIVGHTHRQSMVLKTAYDIQDHPKVLTAVETGCMCRLDTEISKVDDRRFPNYTALPDWQQGFATAYIWPDGRFRLDLATYVNGELFYQDQRYK